MEKSALTNALIVLKSFSLIQGDHRVCLKSLCWAGQEKLISLSGVYSGFLDMQGGNVFFFFFGKPTVQPNEMLPAHSVAKIAGRVHSERVTSSSPTFPARQWRLPGEIRYNGLKYLLCAGLPRYVRSRLIVLLLLRMSWPGGGRHQGTWSVEGQMAERWMASSPVQTLGKRQKEKYMF